MRNALNADTELSLFTLETRKKVSPPNLIVPAPFVLLTLAFEHIIRLNTENQNWNCSKVIS